MVRLPFGLASVLLLWFMLYTLWVPNSRKHRLYQCLFLVGSCCYVTVRGIAGVCRSYKELAPQ